MTSFLQFRIWFRRASVGQQAAALVSALLAVGLVVWAAVPSGSPASALAVSNSGAASSAADAQPSGADQTVGTSPSGSPGTSLQLPGTSGQPSTGTGSGTGSGTGTVSGNTGPATPLTTLAPSNNVTPKVSSTTLPTTLPTTGTSSCKTYGTIKVGAIYPVAAGGTINSLIGSPPADQEKADYAAVIDAVNKAGGVDCNKLEGIYIAADETSSSSATAACQTLVQDKVFAALGGFLPAFPDTCLLENNIPTFDQLEIDANAVQKYYPYYLSPDPTYQVLYKNFVDGVNQMGYFTPAKHFAKLGIFYRDCIPAVNKALIDDLAAVGVSGNKVVTYDLGCPAQFASPTAIQAGVVKFKAAGVTTMTIDNDLPDIQNISNIANSDNFHPAGGWMLADDGSMAITASANFHPNSTEFDNAVAITPDQYGAIHANIPETAGTKKCDAIMTSHGLPTVYQSGDQFAGSPCSLVWMLVTAIKYGGVSQTNLINGLHAAKSFEYSFPNGPNDFTAAGTATGGQFWRPALYHSNCQCWAVTNPNWQPSFK